MAAVCQLILEILNDLSHKELKEFKKSLELTVSKKGPTDIPWHLNQTANNPEIVALIVQNFGKKSVEVAKNILMDMNRTDLVLRLSETNLEPKGKTKKKENVGFLNRKL